MTYKNGLYNSKEYIELKTALLDAERTKTPVTFYTRDRVYIDRYTCIDKENQPVTLDKFITHGGLIYYKINQFEWCTISLDDVLRIELHYNKIEKTA